LDKTKEVQRLKMTVAAMETSHQFFGLRGLRLKAAMVLLVVMPSFLLFGYNNGSSGGIVGLESFVQV
jgi:hypothetical protein